MAEARVIKFCTLVGYIKSQHKVMMVSPVGLQMQGVNQTERTHSAVPATIQSAMNY